MSRVSALLRIGDGKVLHIGIYHEGWRPTCGEAAYRGTRPTYWTPETPGRKPKGLCVDCDAVTTLVVKSCYRGFKVTGGL